MRIVLVALAALLVVGVVVAGCSKPAEDEGKGAAPMASPKPAEGAAAEVAPGTEDAITLKSPDGESLVVTPGGDDTWLAGVGLEPYPGGKLYKIDVDATVEAAKEASEEEMTESAVKNMADGLALLETAVVYQTSDSLDDIRAWADGLEGFSAGEVSEDGGISSFEIKSDDEASFVGGNVFQMADDDTTRYVMLVDASAMMDELMKGLEAGLSEMGATTESGAAESATTESAAESKPAEAATPAGE